MLRERLTESLKSAMKAKDARRSATVRLILAALKDRDIAARGSGDSEGLGEEEILHMMQTMIRQRRESIEMYKKGQRDDLVDQEEGEIRVIEEFLPKQMSEDEVSAASREIIAELDAHSIKDMGQVMGELKSRYAGKMDFGKASQVVKGLLT
ncbi:MAG: glutamyl-tRNA amidotransferase [Alphaproteobacteria bacterium]|nr:glutamyl-tRNA amidotransferase [Alphaproteobacteria bacterium]|tara:strand:- start:1311 stop:1766 length:456 start_codon:yes stop_codon:yes gene_type:complete